MKIPRTLLLVVAAGAASLLPAFAQAALTPVPPVHKFSPLEIKQAVAAIAAKGTPVAPCLCLKDWVDHCKKTSATKWYYLSYTLSITSNNGIVLYSEGALTWDNVANRLQHVQTAGDTEYFNGARDVSGHPFNYNPAQSKLKFTINANCNAVVQHGTSQPLVVPLLCNNNILYGFLPAHGDAYLISLSKREMDIPR